jgi:drug/metabolite transporter, DME family
MAEGTSANAIFLQYTAPMWMFLASVWWLGEPADRRSCAALAISLVGIGIIVVGGGKEAQLNVVALGLGSGVCYAGVVICLRVLRDASSRWLTVLNLLFSAAVLAPFVVQQPLPSMEQLFVLFLYGAGQMAIPYWLMARGVRSLSAQEAGTITLLEPILNPLWAFLVSGEVPSSFECVGGAFILGALVWRYWPFNREDKTAKL